MAFIVFEGLDGSGKSTLIQHLIQDLKSLGINYLVTREPGGTPLGDELRAILLRTHKSPPTPLTELLLYEAIRAQHVECVIEPALKKGQWVICDRFTASTIAFQSHARGLKRSDIEWINQLVTQGLTPDLTVLIDVSIETSIHRRKKREDRHLQPEDRFEKENKEFHTKVHQSYLLQAKENPQKWIILDGEKSSDFVYQELKGRLSQWLHF